MVTNSMAYKWLKVTALVNSKSKMAVYHISRSLSTVNLIPEMRQTLWEK